MLKNAIKTLAENYDTPLSQLQQYKEVVEQNLNNPELFQLIKGQFRPTSLKVGSAGAYLWGCDQNYYGNVSKSCSALCNGAIQYNNSLNTCQYQIWTYDNEELIPVRNISNSRAYIYVDKNWLGFLEKDIEKLKNSNVSFATVLTTVDSQHETLTEMTSVDNLPIIKDYEKYENYENIAIETSSSSLYYWLLVFIIIIVSSYYMFTKLYNSE